VADIVDRLYRINAEGTKGIRAMILSDDVSGDDSIDDGTEWDGDSVELREGDWESAEGDDHCCSKVSATDSCVFWTGQDAVGWGKVESSTSTQKAKRCDKITWVYWPGKISQYGPRKMELSHFR
jgi:hypothetical protein